jgi:hypothetical protein
MYFNVRLSKRPLIPEQSAIECCKRYWTGCKSLPENLRSMEFIRYKGLCSYSHNSSSSWLICIIISLVEMKTVHQKYRRLRIITFMWDFSKNIDIGNFHKFQSTFRKARFVRRRLVSYCSFVKRKGLCNAHNN